MNIKLTITQVITKVLVASLLIAALLTQPLAAFAQAQPTGTGKTLSAPLLGQTIATQQTREGDIAATDDQLDATNQTSTDNPSGAYFVRNDRETTTK